MISPGALGAMSVVVLLSWLFANFWLAFCRVIPPLRPHLGLCYAIAVVMAYLPFFVLYGGPDVVDVAGATIAAGIVIAQYLWAARKAKRRKRTIPEGESSDAGRS
jgi:hypothetical protein